MEKYYSEGMKSIFHNFSSLTDYNEKLIFFDKYFGLIPFRFPFFRAGLEMLMKGEEINSLIEIYYQEQKGSLLLTRDIVCNEGEFFFSVKPSGYNRTILNDFIIQEFIRNDAGFNEILLNIKKNTSNNKLHQQNVLEDAKDLLSSIAHKLKHPEERSFRQQFLNVFFKGYSDYKSKYVKRFPSTKKIIELYLYAQGILYAKYIDVLQQNRVTNKFNYPGQSEKINSYDINELERKIYLLFENGILHYLYTKSITDKKLSQLVTKLLGYEMSLVEKVLLKMKHKQFLH